MAWKWPCRVKSITSWPMVTLRLTCEQTDMNENITFPQLRCKFSIFTDLVCEARKMEITSLILLYYIAPRATKVDFLRSCQELYQIFKLRLLISCWIEIMMKRQNCHSWKRWQRTITQVFNKTTLGEFDRGNEKQTLMCLLCTSVMISCA